MRVPANNSLLPPHRNEVSLNTHDLKFSVLIPVFNGASTILETMDSILSQSYENFEIIVQDNDSTDDTPKLVHSFSDPRIKYFKNASNLGYSLNLREGRKNCAGEILFLMSSDDLLLKDALLNTYEAFQADPGVGAVTRPYYWFGENKHTPIRVTCHMNPLQNETVKITDDFSKIRCVLDNEVLGQLSGLAFRMDCMDIDFSLEPWIAHGYPMAAILKNHSITFLKDYQVAVRVGMNETRKKSPLYDRSPMMRWIDLFNEVYFEPEFKNLKRKCIREIVANNYLGLIQIKNFGSFYSLIREICYLVKYRWLNFFNPKFWFFSAGTLLIPSFILLPLLDWYKERILSRMIKKQGLALENSKEPRPVPN